MNKKALVFVTYLAIGSLYATHMSVGKEDIKTLALSKALESNVSDKQKIRELLKGANINAKDSTGSTPLMLAVEHPSVEIFKLILKQSPDLNAQDNYGRTALMRAIEFGSKPVVELLLAAGANPDIVDNYGRTIFQLSPQFKGVREVLVELKERKEKAGNSSAPRR